MQERGNRVEDLWTISWKLSWVECSTSMMEGREEQMKLVGEGRVGEEMLGGREMVEQVLVVLVEKVFPSRKFPSLQEVWEVAWST